MKREPKLLRASGYTDLGLKVSKDLDKRLWALFEKWGTKYNVRELQLMLYLAVGFHGTMFSLQKQRAQTIKRRGKS